MCSCLWVQIYRFKTSILRDHATRRRHLAVKKEGYDLDGDAWGPTVRWSGEDAEPAASVASAEMAGQAHPLVAIATGASRDGKAVRPFPHPRGWGNTDR
jgi:hypothetical protein